MNERLKELIRLMNEFNESDEGIAYFKELNEKHRIEAEIKSKRIEKLVEYLKNQDFDKIMDRMILEHNDDYRDKCYNKGYEPYPNNKLNLFFDFLEKNYHPIEDDTIHNGTFSQTIYFYKGYFFTKMYGQGTATLIYGKDKQRIITL
jgi:hypothetical protein